jgi:transcriptional regulator of acetoin/glycerol metabolism
MVCEGSKIKKEDFALNIVDVTGNAPGKFEMNSMNEQMKNYTLQVLEHTGGNISEAARILDVSRATIYSVLNRKGV